MNMSMKQNQKGNILLIILVIVAIIAMIAAYATSGKSSSGPNAASSLAASALMSDGSAFSNTAQQEAITNTVTVASLLFTPAANLSSNTNILAVSAPDGIGMPYPSAPGKALNSTLTAIQGYYVFDAAAVGVNAVVTPSILIAGVTDATCASVNLQLYGTAVPAIASGATNAVLMGTPTAAVPVSTAATVVATTTNPKGGCISSSDGANQNVIAIPL